MQKFTTIFILFVSLFFYSLGHSSIQESLRSAESNVQAGNLDEALQTYHDLMKNDLSSIQNKAAFYYNYATIASKKGDLGLAYALIMRAKNLAPFDTDIKNNASFIEAKVLNRDELAIPYQKNVLNQFSPFFWFTLSLVFGVGSLLMIWFNNTRNLVFVLINLCALVPAGIGIYYLFTLPLKHALVSTDNTIVTSGPSETFSQITVVPKGSVLAVIERRGDWVKVRFHRERTLIGWVNKESLLYFYEEKG